MEECDYCGETFRDEGALLEHLDAAHYEELGRIDRRRVDERKGGGGERDLGPYAIVFVVLLSAAIVAYVVFGVGGSSGPSNANGAIPAPERTPFGSGVHEHGTMEVVILGDGIDFSQDRYQVADSAFHFENGNGRIWHTHAQGITVQYALWTLGIGVTGDAVIFGDVTYEDGQEYDVSITVNGEPVDPTSYVLQGVQDPNQAQQGDSVRVVVERA